jgi:hypothetical protein
MMFDRMCYWFSGKTGQCVVGALGVVGGLHLLKPNLSSVSYLRFQ